MTRLARLLDAHVNGYGIDVEHGRDIPLLCTALLAARQEAEEAKRAAVTPTREGDPEWHYGFRAVGGKTLHVVEGVVERATWDRLRALLGRIQWRASDAEGDPKCPECGGYKDDLGHGTDCALAAALSGAADSLN